MRSVVSHPLDELTGDEVRISYPPCSRERRLLTLPTLTHVADSVWGGADGSQISDISLAVRKYGVAKGIKAFKFITAGLVPPAKEKVLAYLGIGISPGQAPSNPPGQLGRHGEIDVGFLFDPIHLLIYAISPFQLVCRLGHGVRGLDRSVIRPSV